MGAGNLRFEFQDRAFDREYPQAHIAYPSTYFIDYSADEDDIRPFAEAMDDLAYASKLPETPGIVGDDDDDCCHGGPATIIAYGKYCKLVAIDGDMGRIAFTIIPLDSYETVIANAEHDNQLMEDPITDEATLAAYAETEWNRYLSRYQAEAEHAAHSIHKAYPKYGDIMARSCAWTCCRMPAYEEHNIQLTPY